MVKQRRNTKTKRLNTILIRIFYYFGDPHISQECLCPQSIYVQVQQKFFLIQLKLAQQSSFKEISLVH